MRPCRLIRDSPYKINRGEHEHDVTAHGYRRGSRRLRSLWSRTTRKRRAPRAGSATRPTRPPQRSRSVQSRSAIDGHATPPASARRHPPLCARARCVWSFLRHRPGKSLAFSSQASRRWYRHLQPHPWLLTLRRLRAGARPARRTASRHHVRLRPQIHSLPWRPAAAAGGSSAGRSAGRPEQ